MNSLTDVLLPPPIWTTALRGLLFLSFYLHLLFALALLGTVVLGVYYYLRGEFAASKEDEDRESDRGVLSSIFVLKSLAIVLGVAPILLIQVGHTIPFMTAINLVAPWWLAVIVLLISSLLLLEVVAERGSYRNRWLHTSAGVLGASLLLIVPGVFVMVVVLSENPSRWAFALNEGGLPLGLSVHWLARYLHVLGAAIVVATAFHYLRLGFSNVPSRDRLRTWMFVGLVFQIVVGVLLYFTLPHKIGWLNNIIVVIGVALALWLLWTVHVAVSRKQTIPTNTLLVQVLLLLMVMLGGRQMIQDQVFLPIDAKMIETTEAYKERLADFPPPVARNPAQLAAYDTNVAIYFRSCEFCHGATANGQGFEAKNLYIPPENVAAVRTTSDYFRDNILWDGIPGTGMPYFSFYTRYEQDDLYDFLVSDMGLRDYPEPIAVDLSPEAVQQADEIFVATCSICHGEDGRGSEWSASFRPPPPDFTRISWRGDWIKSVLENGYPGTMMRPFPDMPEATRWALADKVQNFYCAAHPELAPAESEDAATADGDATRNTSADENQEP